jgi:hypothetical protein
LVIVKFAFLAYLTVSTLAVAVGQTGFSISPETVAHRDDTNFLQLGTLQPGVLNEVLARHEQPSFPTTADEAHHGLISRSLKRGLQDQKQLWLAPFKPSNIKWDALFLTGTAVLLATDRQFSRALLPAIWMRVEIFRM